MKKALYIRVSTDEQAAHGFSLGAQKDSLVAFCKSQGWNEYEVYMDDGYSGTTLERPALTRMIRDVKNQRVDSVIVFRLDRLSRRQRHCLHLIEEVFEPNGVSFRSATEPFDTSTPLGKAMIGILSVFAQLERDTIIERTKEGHYKRARQGLWGGGPQPFGYRWNKEVGRLEIVPSEAEIVREVFSRVARGHSLASVAEWVEMRATGNRWWDGTVIKNMILRDLYIGRVQYGVESADGTHDAIVDEETMIRARKVLDGYRYKQPIGSYLLSGLLRCGECGEPMLHHAITRGKYPTTHYYVCNRKQAGRKYYKGGDPCPSKHQNMQRIDAKVIEHVKTIATNRDMITSVIAKQRDVKSDVRERIAQYESDLSEIERKLQRWTKLFDEEQIDTPELMTHVKELRHERNKILMLLDDARDDLEIPDIKPMFDMLDAVNDTWDEMMLDEQKEVLRGLIHRVEVFKDASIQVEWNLNISRQD